MPAPLLLLVLTAALAQDDWGETPLVPLELLFREPPEPPERPAATWTAAQSHLDITVRGGELRVVQVLRLEPLTPGWVSLPVLDGRVRLEGSPPVQQGPDGQHWYTGYLDRPLSLRLEGTLAVSATQLSLRVAPGVRQSVEARGEGLEVVVAGAVAGALPPSGTVQLSWGPAVERREAVLEVVQAQSAVAAWLEDDALAARARVRFLVRRGERQQLRVRLPGAPKDLTVRGPGVERWERVGDEVRVTLAAPARGAVELTLEWRVPFAGGAAVVALPEPLDARAEPTWLSIGGSSEALLSPTAPPSLRPVALSALPEGAQALGDAPPAAAWSGKGALTVRMLRLEPIEGPPLVIDAAECVQAAADHGRSLLRCRLDVRNDSRQFLQVQPPQGGSLWTARVNGEGVSPVRREDGTIAVPLERSVETLAGLTTLDVELTFLLEGQAWARRGEQSLALPSFDADLAVLRWAVLLPPGYEAEPRGGSARAASGETAASLSYASTSVDQARDTWNLALQAYQDNDFAAAQTWVDTTLSLDPANENALRLQTNLDVLNAPPPAADKPAAAAPASAEEEAMSRRVKDMARSKVAYKEVEQEEAMRRADELLAQGNYDEATVELERAVELSQELLRYEQTESVEQVYRSSSSNAKLDEAKKRSEDDRRRSNSASSGARQLPDTLEGQVTRPEVEIVITRGETWMGGGETGEDDGGDHGEVLAEPVYGVPGYAAIGSGPEDAGGTVDLLVLDGQLYGAAGQEEAAQDFLNSMGYLGDVSAPGGIEYSFDDVDIAGELVVVEGEALSADLPADPGVSGLLGALRDTSGLTGEGLGGLGVSGAGVGGGGTAEGLGGLGTVTTTGRGSGYGSGGGSTRAGAAAVEYREATEIALEEEPAPAPVPVITRDALSVVASVPGTQTVGVGGRGRAGGRDEAAAPPPPPRPPGQAAPSPAAGPATGTASSGRLSLQAPDLAATSLAIPLPEHGARVEVSQRLLAPGEVPTLTLRYRESR